MKGQHQLLLQITFSLISIFGIQQFGFGQAQGNIWYFGEQAGIDFNQGEPKALLDGALVTDEGCASISDPRGNLLFYTDGITVWNKNHEPMPNGTNLMGDPSSTQSGVIVPEPESTTRYYVFTVAKETGTDGLRYSVVDMARDGGNGDVIQKNQALYSRSTEKITAVFHKNEVDFWVITHGWSNNAFFAHKVTRSGISKNPVLSYVGARHQGLVDNSIGQMTASSDGKKIALACYSMNVVELFDFDNETGKISQPITLPSTTYDYGVSFSPDNTKLYISTWNQGGTNTITQYDLNAGDGTAVANSGVVVAKSNTAYGSLQLATDQRIYVTRYDKTFLGTINNPNEKGTACSFQEKSFDLEGRLSKGGLPTIIQSYFVPPSINFDGICFGSETEFNLSKKTNIDELIWDFGDPSSGNNSSNALEPKHVFSKPGKYTVSLTIRFLRFEETITKEIEILPNPSVDLPENITVCEGEVATISVAPPAGTAIRWSNGATTPQIEVSKASDLVLNLENQGCTSIFNTTVEFQTPPTVEIPQQLTFCEDSSATISLDIPNATYLWSNSETSNSITVTTEGTYQVTVTQDKCEITSQTIVSTDALPEIALDEELSICAGNQAQLTATSTPSATVVWSNGNLQNAIQLSEAGEYTATITNGECEVTALTKVNVVNPTANLGSDTAICAGDQLELSVDQAKANFQWSNGSTNPAITIDKAGNYAVTVSIDDCETTGSVEVSVLDPKVDLGSPDTAICADQSITLNAEMNASGVQYSWSDGSSEPIRNISESGDYALTVSIGNCSVSDQKSIQFDPIIEASLMPQTTICLGESAEIGGFDVPNAAYRWSTGETTPNITISEGGGYDLTITAGACEKILSTQLVVESIEKEIQPTANICKGDEYNVDARLNGAAYAWSDGSTEGKRALSEAGDYQLTITAGACTLEKSINLTVDSIDTEIGQDTVLCEGEQLALEVNLVAGSVTWSNGSTSNPTIITSSGDYAATVNQGACSLPTESISVTFEDPPIVELGEDQKLCEGEEVELSLNFPNSNITWSNGETDPSIQITTSDNYAVTVTRGNCEATDAVNIQFDEKPIVELENEIRICAGETVELNVRQENATYAWSNGQTSSFITVAEEGDYSVTVNRGVCTTNGNSTVTVDEPIADLGNDTLLCFDEVLSLDANQANATFAWSDGSSTPQVQIREPGQYQLTVSIGDCSDEDQINIEFGRPEITNLPEDTTICDDQELIVGGITGADKITWSDGRAEENVRFDSEGQYSVTASTGRCEVSSSMDLTVLPKVFDLGNDTTLCKGESFTISAEAEGATYAWSSGETTPSITIDSAQTIVLTRSVGSCEFTDEFNVSVLDPNVNFPQDTTICAGDQVLLTAEQETNASYLWNTGATTSSINTQEEGNYSVTVTMDRCTDESSINIVVNEPIADLGPDTSICAGDSVSYDFNNLEATYSWSDGTDSPNKSFSKTGEYSLTTTIGSCIASDAFELTVNNPVVDLGESQILCAGNDFELDVSQENATYLWSNGASTPVLPITDEGSYAVTVSIGNCSAVDDVDIIINQPMADLGADTTLCAGEQYVLNVEGEEFEYLWSDGSTNPTLTVSSAGEYEVTVSEGKCEKSDKVTVDYNSPLAFLGKDTTLCEGDRLEYDISQENASYTWSDGFSGPKRSLTESGNYMVTVNIGRCEATDDINLDYNLPEADFGVADTVICESEEVELKMNQTNAEYTWSTGESTPSIIVSTPGIISLTVSIGACSDSSSIKVEQKTIDLSLPDQVTICNSDSFEVNLSQNVNSIINWSDNSNSSIRYLTEEGNYSVTVANGRCNETATVDLSVNNPNANIGNDTILCPSEVLVLDATQENAAYAWSDGSNSSTKEITKSGTYNLTVSMGECQDIGKLSVFYNDPSFELPNDTTLCNEETLDLAVEKEQSEFLWSNGNASNSITISDSGLYALTVSMGRCTAEDQIEVSYNRPKVELGNDTTLCMGETLTLLLNEPNTRYQWSDGTSGGEYTVIDSGLKKVTAFQGRCEKTDSIQIAFSDPKVDLGPDTTICKGETVILDAGNDGVSYAWSDQSGEQQLRVQEEGNYWVNILDQFNCSATDSAYITYDSAVVDLGADTVICPKVDSLELVISDTSLLFAWNDGSTAQNKYAFADQEYSVTVTNPNGCQAIDVINIGMRDDCLKPLYVPRVFSPNYDDKNDGWACLGDAFDFHVRIWDRSGTLVFESFDHTKQWDGRMPNDEKASVGNYIMIIEYIDIYDNPHRISEALTLWR